MPYFLSDENLSVGKETKVSGEEARHILVHRPKKGEVIKLQGPDGKRFISEILEIGRDALKLKIEQSTPVPNESSVAITLFQSVVSEKAFDFIFQKGTELGLGKIVLFNSKNTATKLSADQFKKKQGRWNKILIEAAKQSERGVWPVLDFVADVDRVVPMLKNFDGVFLTDIGGKKISTFDKLSSVAIIVGPEGGFTGEEVSQFKSLSNVEAVTLGPILLRAETASLAALAIIQNSV